MARLIDLRQPFMPLSWANKLLFMEEYRTKRYNDLNTVQEFNLSKQKKTKSTKVREKKEPVIKKVTQKQLNNLTPEQLSLMKQLGLA